MGYRNEVGCGKDIPIRRGGMRMLPSRNRDERPWIAHLGDHGQLRHARPRDIVAASRLMERGALLYDERGQEPTLSLLSAPSIVWHRDGELCGAMLLSLYRQPVVALRSVIVAAPDLAPMLGQSVLPAIHAHLAELGMTWIATYGPADWLRHALAEAGHRCHCEVIGYAKKGFDHAEMGNEQVKVRNAYGGDVDTILAIDLAAFEPFWWLNRAILRRASRASDYFLLAELAGRSVGYFMADRMGAGAYVGRIAVLPEAQGQRIGASLMHRALQLMARDGLQGVSLNTQRRNTRSQALYGRFDFVPTGEAQRVWSFDLGK